MRRFSYAEYNEDDKAFIIIKTEQEILEDYWKFWSDKMEQKFGAGHKLITKQNCIEDWVTTHWAVEVK